MTRQPARRHSVTCAFDVVGEVRPTNVALARRGYPSRMPHPIMFRDDDFGLADVRTIALSYPEAFEKVSWGRPVFCAPKIFLMFGGSAKSDQRGEYVQYPYSILVKVDESDREALSQDPRFFYPAYMGPSGWLGLDLKAGKKLDWDEVRELIDASFRMVAPKKLIRRLDEV